MCSQAKCSEVTIVLVFVLLEDQWLNSFDDCGWEETSNCSFKGLQINYFSADHRLSFLSSIPFRLCSQPLSPRTDTEQDDSIAEG